MHVLRRCALALAGVALLGAAPAVGASTGVSIDVGRIDVSQSLAPGGEYRLPTFGVRNPGTEATTYRLVVSYVDGQDAASPPEAWFAFDPGALTLGPDESRAVATSVVVPPDAAPGQYAALIGPQIVGAGAGGAQVGAAAAVRLTFTVGESSGLDGWLRMLGRFLADNPWLLALAGLLLLLVAVRIVRRHFTFEVGRRT
jgi:hypothetical protein